MTKANLANRIVATDHVDIAHLSDGEIVATGCALLGAYVSPASANNSSDGSGISRAR